MLFTYDLLLLPLHFWGHCSNWRWWCCCYCSYCSHSTFLTNNDISGRLHVFRFEIVLIYVRLEKIYFLIKLSITTITLVRRRPSPYHGEWLAMMTMINCFSVSLGRAGVSPRVCDCEPVSYVCFHSNLTFETGLAKPSQSNPIEPNPICEQKSEMKKIKTNWRVVLFVFMTVSVGPYRTVGNYWLGLFVAVFSEVVGGELCLSFRLCSATSWGVCVVIGIREIDDSWENGDVPFLMELIWLLNLVI